MERPGAFRFTGPEIGMLAKRMARLTRSLVEQAVGHLEQYGETDHLGRKWVIVRDPRSGNTYEITDPSPRKDSGVTRSGLFIHPVVLHENGNILRHWPGIQTPRSPEAVSRRSISHLGSVTPLSMGRAVRELRRAQKVGHSGLLGKAII